MNDSYPTHLTIDIDRDRLRRYLRLKWLLLWSMPLCFMGGIMGLATISKTLDDGLVSGGDVVFLLLRHVGAGAGGGLFLALLCYVIFSHRTAARVAATLKVRVEGPFLRIQQHGSDRKLHFRSIVDYATIQDAAMRRCGIQSLHMSTTSGGPQAFLLIPGVKDCLRVRDLLADIDRVRENT